MLARFGLSSHLERLVSPLAHNFERCVDVLKALCVDFIFAYTDAT